ncbi:cytochrome P450 [Aspergillus mulundensis]|uniref:Putative Cytochrome P450 monooxygenase n=1 Tax=Aspergillus mulundensis TaxID=1810919 RepID=A0A3D8SVV5_9EURO|nr:putative Cytochrome P450 monooxygenase [Aspergillus mulundensis]RDW89918.1 putative Cytochrome P450 monooxygenase [Aspergillus mulundensis]
MTLWSGAGTTDILLSLLWTAIAYTALKPLYNITLHPLSSFPGPRTWAASYAPRFIASITGNLELSIKQLHETYGPVVRYSPSELSFTSPTAWKDIYGFGDNAPIKDPSFYSLIHLSRDKSNSIFTAGNDDHPRVRKALSYAFSERALREQEGIVKGYVDLLVQRLRRLAGSSCSSADKDQGLARVDLVEWYNFTTFDIIGDLAIGQSFNCLLGSKYHEWVHGFMSTIKLGAYVRAMAVCTHDAFPQLLRLLAPRRLTEARRRHLEFVGRSTEERLAKGLEYEKPDFISCLLKGNGRVKGEHAPLSAGEVEANTNFLLLAGTETTATALSGTTYYLLKNRDALRKATAEVRGAFGREDEISFVAAAERLPYVQACIAEGLRIYPPGPIAPPRRTRKGTVTLIAGHAVPGDVSVGVHAWSASHSAENFYQGGEFLPERWLGEGEGEGPFSADQAAASQPFSYGPRNCLGKPFAYNEMRVILARVLWNFDLELAPESEGWERQKVYTLWDKGPLMVRLRVRADK